MQDDIRDRYRTARRPKTAVPPTPRPAAPSAEEPKPSANKPKKSRKKLLFSLLTLVTILALAGGVWNLLHHASKPSQAETSPVPASIRQAVSFPIYFPNSKKLPAGYSFNSSSFSAGSGAVEFVIYNGQHKVVFTEQAQPSEQALQQFATSRIPLHNSVNTTNGTALVGAIGNNTIVSLPTSDNTWIIISAPVNINQTDLKTVLNSLIH